MISIALKYYHTLKYLSYKQTFGRLFAKLSSKITFLDIFEIDNISKSNCKLSTKINFYKKNEKQNSRLKIISNEFTFLNKTKKFGDAIDWEAKDEALLWRFNLHYFDYIFLLNKEEREAICINWIDKNKNKKSAAWHSYVLSLRIVNWIKADLKNEKIRKSLYKQAKHLYKNIEFYFPGNHLLENAKALIYAGLYFMPLKTAKKFLARGIQIFKEELPRQINKDGVYFELSPMYHSIMLEGILDILNIFPENLDKEFCQLLRDTAGKMSDFLISCCHPDGKISLFNDSTLEIAMDPKNLNEYSQKILGRESSFKENFSESGYFIHKTERCYLIIDGGKIGPDFLPAHAHSDIFSYELSLDGKRIIVDTGVSQYHAGEARKYERSSKAHNSVSIDDFDHAEFWSSFRVARRFYPKDINFRAGTGYCVFQGTFDGYSKLVAPGIVHTRYILVSDFLSEIIVKDFIHGYGDHKVESFIHFHPDIVVEKLPKSYLLKNDEKEYFVIVENGNSHIEDTYYSPEFGKKIPNKTMVISQKSLPSIISYKIKF